jgi:hypothetical protein
MIQGIINGIANLLESNQTVRSIRNLVPICSVCGQATSNHRYAVIGSAFKEMSVEELFRLIDQREWSEIGAFHEYHPMKESLIIGAILGPHSGGLLVACKDPFSLSEPKELFKTVELSTEEVKDLTARITQKEWIPLDAKD